MEYAINVLNIRKNKLSGDISLPIENWKIKSKRLEKIKCNIQQLEKAIKILEDTSVDSSYRVMWEELKNVFNQIICPNKAGELEIMRAIEDKYNNKEN